MFKKSTIMLLLLLTTVSLYGCNKKNNDDKKEKEDYSLYYLDEFKDNKEETSINKLTDVKYNVNNSYVDVKSYKLDNRKHDVKYEFIFNKAMRSINLSDGYGITIPSSNATIDYSLSKLRVKYLFNDCDLTVSTESSSPYGNTKNGWSIYRNEWLTRYLDNDIYLEDNNLVRLDNNITRMDLLNGYEVLFYSIRINDFGDIEMPYYNIAVVREVKEYINFNLFVMKSKTNQKEAFLDIIKSFKKVNKRGKTSLHIGSLEVKKNPSWDIDTSNYFDLMQDTNNFDFGFFSYSMANENAEDYESQFTKIENTENELEALTGYHTDIIPTYMHLGWYSKNTYFPNTQAAYFGGGNGFNGKKVLQFTFQFTRNNNNVNIYNHDSNYTPMFDILRGKYDDYFRQLARDIKAYKMPVLFRLNNEMNTDWTSYCGLITLLDPDIFRLTWIRLYNIFEEENVTNCIWIFNPIATSCPYSSWGEDMCYMPGIDYVQALGITYYEMNNGDASVPFRTCYGGILYTKNKETWANYPWIIGEFGCGSGGELDGATLYRNESFQASWVKDLFEVASNKNNLENEFFKKISAAIWFNCDDVNADGKIYNALKIKPNLTNTINEFKNGLAKIKK